MRFSLESGIKRQITRETSHASIKNKTAKNGLRKTPISHVIVTF